MSYGGGTPWGGSFYGGGSGTISLAAARASATHNVIVALSAATLAGDPFRSGDALNPLTWTVQNLTTLEFFTVAAVREFDRPSFEYELQIIEPLANHLIQHQIKSTTLRAAAGYLVTAPNSADFAGVVDEIDPVARTNQRRFPSRDLRNPPVAPANEGIGGTLQIDADGDYGTETGSDLVTKLILRRIFTKRGGFFHLPEYGLGLALKEPVRGGDVLQLKAEVIREVKKEPDVDLADATVTLSRQGVLVLLIRYTLAQTGQEIQVGIRADSRTGQVVEL